MDMKSLVPWRRDRGDVTKSEPFEGLPGVFGLPSRTSLSWRIATAQIFFAPLLSC